MFNIIKRPDISNKIIGAVKKLRVKSANTLLSFNEIFTSSSSTHCCLFKTKLKPSKVIVFWF